MNIRRTSLIILSIIFLAGALYANETIRTYILETTTDGPNSYASQVITTLSGASLVNKDNDDDLGEDFFSGNYYDSAYGVFSFDALDDSVHITNTSTNSSCTGDTLTHDGYELAGYSWSPDFGAVDFSDVYICVPKDQNTEEDSYIGGYAYSKLIGFQNFDGVTFRVNVTRDSVHASDGRYTKIDGLASSQNYNEVDTEFQDEVRVVGNMTKSSLKKQVLQNVYKTIRNISSDNSSLSISSTSLGGETWSAGGGTLLQNNRVLYFGDLNAGTVVLNSDANQNSDINGNKTLVVEGGNIYIRGNIRDNSNNGMLGLIAISKEGQGGNIYIHPSVTDIHASIYADSSVLSYNGSELDGNTPDEDLANQLYIYGSIFSENTLGGAKSDGTGEYTCPFYVNVSCDLPLAKKYDFNYLRRYILVTEMIDGVPGEMYPNYNGNEAYMGDNNRDNTDTEKPGYRKYPFVIEYDPDIQNSPPPFF